MPALEQCSVDYPGEKKKKEKKYKVLPEKGCVPRTHKTSFNHLKAVTESTHTGMYSLTGGVNSGVH